MSNDTFFSRRLFLTRGVQLLSTAATLPLFLDHSARALAADFTGNPQGAGRPDHILVVVQLAGGNDGLNTVIPYRDDQYHRARPRIGIPAKDVLRASDAFGFHPSAVGFKKLYDQGCLSVLHGVGYPNANRSHFRSSDIWQTAEPEKTGQSGWLGRYFDACCSGADPGGGAAPTGKNPAASESRSNASKQTTDPADAISLTTDPPITLQGEKFLPITFRTPGSLNYVEARRGAGIEAAFDKLNAVDPELMDRMDAIGDSEHRKPGSPGEGGDSAIAMPMGANGSLTAAQQTNEFLQRSALNARVYAETIKKSVATVQNKAIYPQSRFAQDLKLVAQMIGAGLSTRVYYVQLGGFDTHADELRRHARLMDDLSNALASFVEDLKAMGHLDRTMVMTFSEFGRRVGENGSGGTDHGEAAPVFVVGGRIQGGFQGTPPDLTPSKLHRGDVPYTLDFRRLYATVVRQWLRGDDATVLGKKFDGLPLIRQT